MSTISTEHETTGENPGGVLPGNAAPSAPDSPGQLLRAARERANLSIGDVSTRLRMGVRQIDALERGDYGALPTGTFLRGFVRNYAKAVNADSDQAIRLLEHNNAEAARLQMATIIVPSQEIQIRGGNRALALPKEKILIAAAIAVFLVGAGWYWWEFVRPHLAAGGRPASSAKAKASAAPAKDANPATSSAMLSPTTALVAPGGNSENPGDSNVGRTRNENDRDFTNPALMVTGETIIAAKPKAAAPLLLTPAPSAVRASSGEVGNAGASHVLGFTFSGDSWVEVSDAGGRVLLSRQYRAGDAGEVRGTAPLSVVVGSAQVTRMADNGKEIDLAPHTKVSVARLVVK